MNDNVVGLVPGSSDSNRPVSSGGGSDGFDRLDVRLRAVENGIVELKTELKHVATKADIQSMQNQMLKWGIGILITTIIAIVAIAFKVS